MVGRTGLRDRLRSLESSFHDVAAGLAVFLVFDRPERIQDRPGLERAMFLQRCLTHERLDAIISALRGAGAWVRLLRGEDEFMAAAAAGELHATARPLKLVYNGIEGGIAHDGFAPGRKALIPAVADSYGLMCANSNPYACALGRHKYHYFTVLRAHSAPVPEVWHYRPGRGWAGGCRPPRGLRVIAKSTYESWSVGVSEDSVFTVDDYTDERVAGIAETIGQAVCVQRFVPGVEVGVTVLALPDPVATAPVEVVLRKAGGDPDAVMTMEDNLIANAVSYRAFDAPPGLLARLATIAIDCYEVLELGAFARMDFRIEANGEPWVSDVGVSPGLGPSGSSSYESVRELDFSHAEFIRLVMAASLLRAGALDV